MDWTDEDRTRGERLERALAARLYGAPAEATPLLAGLDPDELEEATRAVREMVRARAYRGTGGIADWYPRTLASAGPRDDTIARFCASAWCGEWRELPSGAPGLSLEEALYRFFVDAGIGEPEVREEEFLGAVVRALAVTPRAQFAWPAELRAAPGGCFAIGPGRVLHAALDGRYLRGPITPAIASLLGEKGASGPEVEPLRASLRAMRLL